jgi:hypothetical protein
VPYLDTPEPKLKRHNRHEEKHVQHAVYRARWFGAWKSSRIPSRVESRRDTTESKAAWIVLRQYQQPSASDTFSPKSIKDRGISWGYIAVPRGFLSLGPWFAQVRSRPQDQAVTTSESCDCIEPPKILSHFKRVSFRLAGVRGLPWEVEQHIGLRDTACLTGHFRWTSPTLRLGRNAWHTHTKPCLKHSVGATEALPRPTTTDHDCICSHSNDFSCPLSFTSACSARLLFAS